MDSVSIEYRIKLDAYKIEVFQFMLNGSTFDLIKDMVPCPPKWTELSFRQCPHCPLNEVKNSHCPVALHLHDIVERFHGTRSIDKVELEVLTEERRVIQNLDIQTAIASILDLVLPTCGCPKTEHLKPLARFHLPLASEEETVFRVTGMYLLAQYFLSHTSSKAGINFDGLIQIYKDLHILNKAIASRLHEATQSDSVKNAFALVDVYSVLVPLLVEDQLVEMRGFFTSYLPERDSKSIVRKNFEKARALKLELVPLDDEVRKSNEPPAWVKGVSWAIENESARTVETRYTPKEWKSVADEILSKSELKLELEPIANEDEKNGE